MCPTATTPEPTPLRRAIGRRMLLVFVVGDILGAGIYALVGQVGAKTGGAIWAAFMAALLLASLTAASYVELAAKYPQAAGAALYVNKAFKRPFLTFMVAFAVTASGVASAATLARAFAGDYLEQFIDVPTLVAAIVFLLVLGAINLRGIEISVKLNLGLTAVEVTGLLLIVAIGVVALAQGHGDLGRNLEFRHDRSVPLAIVGGAALAFYALIGFEDSVNVAEEVKDPPRAYPLALFGGLAVAGLIYLLVTLTASMVVDTPRLTASSGPLLEVVREGPLGIPLKLFSFIALLAVSNGALINLIMASRLVYGMAEQRLVPGQFERVLRGRQTPYVAIAFTTLLAIALAATGDLGALADTTVFLLLLVFAIVNVTVLVLRRDPVAREHFRTPTALPVLGAAATLFLFVHSAVDNPAVLLRGGLLLVSGACLWVLGRLAARISAT
jgi:APA family basic amino acid/polyamine antiporter